MFPNRRIITSGGDKFRDEYSLAFDGTNDYVNCGDNADYHHDNGSASLFSVSIWVKITNSTSNDDTIISKYDYGNDKREWRISLDGSQNVKVVISIDGTSASWATNTGSALITNRWYHVVFTYDGSEGTANNRPNIYIDGQVSTLSHNNTHPAQVNEDDCALTIGSMLDSGVQSALPPINVSEATFYNTTLSASQVKTLYNGREPYNHKEGVASSNLAGWWRMGDASLDRFNIIADEASTSMGGNLATNGTFDSNTTGWTAKDSTVSHETSAPILGAGSIKASSLSNASAGFYQDMSLTEGSLYEVKGVMQLLTGSSNGTIKVINSAGNGGSQDILYSGTIGGLISGGDAVPFTAYITALSSQPSIQFAANVADGSFLVDSVTVRLVSGNTGVMTNMDADDFIGDTP